MKICVHLHLFYTDMLDEMLQYIRNLSADAAIEYDLFVTMCEHNEQIEQQIYAFKDNAQIIRVPNRGYDLAPFLHVTKMLNLDNYDFIIKLHTKRNLATRSYLPTCSFIGSEWRNKLLEFCASPKNIALCLKTFAKYPDAGMLTSPELIISDKKQDTAATSRALRILNGMGLQLKDKNFVAGTMFIARAKLFKIWQMLPYDSLDFEEFDVTHKGGTLAHALERILGYIVSAQGYKIMPYRRVRLITKIKSLLYRMKNFVFSKRINSKNKLHIKIFRITVYSKQL